MVIKLVQYFEVYIIFNKNIYLLMKKKLDLGSTPHLLN